MEKELKANAGSVETTLGGGANSHLGLLMLEEKYTTHSATPFVVPAHPGITPLFPPGTTQINARIISTQHENLVYIYELCRNVTNALRQQILAALEHKYIDILEDQHTGYSNVAQLQIIEYLYANHGCVSNTDLKENDKEFRKPIDVYAPIELVWKRIQDCRDYADQGNTLYTNAQVLHNVKSLFKKQAFLTSTFENLTACQRINKRMQNSNAASTLHGMNIKTMFATEQEMQDLTNPILQHR